MLSSEHVATRSAVLQLREEHGVVLDAYDFLDEKRLLLAAEILRQLKRYEKLLAEYKKNQTEAKQAFEATVKRHGLHGTQVYPAHYLEDAEFRTKKTQFMGVRLIDSKVVLPEDRSRGVVCNPSPEAGYCRKLFLQLLDTAGTLAGLSGNIYRLSAEYKRTERRARALENVVIPDIEHDLREMSALIEELDQEDVIRVFMKNNYLN